MSYIYSIDEVEEELYCVYDNFMTFLGYRDTRRSFKLILDGAQGCLTDQYFELMKATYGDLVVYIVQSLQVLREHEALVQQYPELEKDIVFSLSFEEINKTSGVSYFEYTQAICKELEDHKKRLEQVTQRIESRKKKLPGLKCV